jgi:hypothetical protein
LAQHFPVGRRHAWIREELEGREQTAESKGQRAEGRGLRVEIRQPGADSRE